MTLSARQLAGIATGRDEPLFELDIAVNRPALQNAIRGTRVLVVGGAGSIGSSTIAQVLRFDPAALHVLDVSENNLAELVRDLRGRAEGLSVSDFRAIPGDYGSEITHRFLLESPPYDLVLNFAALKHVRSEKDIPSLLQMIDVNIVRQQRFMGWLQESGHGARYFAVSTDKAANPVNLMGATKRLMEHIMFATPAPDQSVTSARFANVAFSDGSLLYGWIHRLAKHQPLAVPRDTKRFFVSLQESGMICLLAAILGPKGHICAPKLPPEENLVELAPIATKFLAHHGLKAVEFEDEDEARSSVGTLLASGQYPLLLTPLDTMGEKAFEEFVGDDETEVEIGLETMLGIPYCQAPEGSVDGFLFLAQSVISDPRLSVDKEMIVRHLQAAIPVFAHIETGKNLDSRV